MGVRCCGFGGVLMPVAIKSVSNSNSCPTHAAGDLLVAFAATSRSSHSFGSGWREIGQQATTWQYDGIAYCWRIATSSSTNAPFGFSDGQLYRVYAITGQRSVNGTQSADDTPFYTGTVGYNGYLNSSSGAGSWTSNASINNYFFAPTYSAPANAGSTYFGGDGYLDYTSGNQFAMGTGDFTAECFFKYRVAEGAIFEIGGPNQIRLGFSGGILSSAVSSFGLQNTSTLSSGWNHAAITRVGGTQYLYVNGQFMGSTPNSWGSVTGTACRLGNRTGTPDPFAGSISNFRVVKGTALYTGTGFITVPTAPLEVPVNGASVIGAVSNTNVNTTVLVGTVSGTSGMVFPANDGPFAAVRNDALRLSLICGYGGGGNPWNNYEGRGRVYGAPGLTRVFDDDYRCFIEGGAVDSTNNGNIIVRWAPSASSGGAFSYATVVVQPKSESGGFFQFF